MDVSFYPLRQLKSRNLTDAVSRTAVALATTGQRGSYLPPCFNIRKSLSFIKYRQISYHVVHLFPDPGKIRKREGREAKKGTSDGVDPVRAPWRVMASQCQSVSQSVSQPCQRGEGFGLCFFFLPEAPTSRFQVEQTSNEQRACL